MNPENVKQQLEKYLESMQTLPPANPDMLTVNLAALREMSRARTGKKVTQIALAAALKRGESTIQQWEYGTNLKGIGAMDLVIMANLFGCRIEEVIAAIVNTQPSTKEEPANLHNTNN